MLVRSQRVRRHAPIAPIGRSFRYMYALVTLLSLACRNVIRLTLSYSCILIKRIACFDYSTFVSYEGTMVMRRYRMAMGILILVDALRRVAVLVSAVTSVV